MFPVCKERENQLRITSCYPSVRSVLVKYRTDDFKYGPRLAQQVEVRAKTDVRYFTGTDRTNEVNK